MHGHDTDWLTHAGHSSLVQSTSSGDTSAPGNDVIILCNGLMFDMHNFYSEPTLKELVQFLFPVASKWYLIGLLISVDESELEKIAADNQSESNACNMCLVKTLKRWLKMVQPKPSWSAIVEALNGVQEEKLAEVIRQKKLKM